MEDNTINIIRETTRNLIKLNRQMHKNEESDIRRCLQEKRISSENILDIANKLKTKTAISEIDLQKLKNGLMEDSQYIEIVLNVHGALRGLIRELTGHNIKKQVAAAGCCCNLALGDVKACTAIAKAAGLYLVAGLDNFTTELAVTCAWTIGNLAGSGVKVCDILLSQGAISKLSDFHNNEDLQDAALYALVHFAYQMKDNLRQDHLNKIIQTLTKLDISTASLQLLFILSCHNNFTENINEDILRKVLNYLPEAIKSTNMQPTHRKLLFITRILANMDIFYNIILKCIDTYNLYEEIKVLVNCNNSVGESLLWLLGNLLNYCEEKELLLKMYS